MLYVPSLNCANQLTLGEDIEALCRCGMKMMHYDVMDGHYVPNLSLSLETASAIRNTYADVSLDVHLMTTEPEKYIEKLKDIGAEYVTFHTDATSFSYRLISTIHAAGMKAGIALNPSDRPDNLLPLLPFVDLVLVMSIEPGFSGQKFIPYSMERVIYLAEKRKELELDFVISVDGGITAQLARQLRSSGADWIIMGMPTIFCQPDGIEGAYKRFFQYMDKDEVEV